MVLFNGDIDWASVALQNFRGYAEQALTWLPVTQAKGIIWRCNREL
jgi:hypothetical protein